MPVYGLKENILACKSDDKAGYTITAPINTTTGVNISFAFTGAQAFCARDFSGTLLNTFTAGYSIWVDAIRVTIPNLSGIVGSPFNVNGSDTNMFSGFISPSGAVTITRSITALNDWLPIRQLIGYNSANWKYLPYSLALDVDFRNTDLTVFSGITIYAYLELKINAVEGPNAP